MQAQGKIPKQATRKQDHKAPAPEQDNGTHSQGL